MKDPAFIQEMISKGRKAAAIVQAEFGNLLPEAIIHTADPEKWSIAQIFDHLIISDSLFFKQFEKISAGNYRMNLWEKWSPMSGFFGNMMKNHLTEKTNRQIKSPRKFLPGDEIAAVEIIPRYLEHLNHLLDYITGMLPVDIDKVIISSRVSGFVTYTLRTAIIIIFQHQYRHINQAINTKKSITVIA